MVLFAAVGALSHEGEHAFSAAVVYLLLGALASLTLTLLGAGLLDPLRDFETIEHLAEFAVIVAIFSAGLKLDRALSWSGWRSVAMLLVIAMPLTIGAVALFGTQAMGLSLGAALILGAVLAPTDPVLAGEVSVGPPGEGDEPEPKFALTGEAGLNDGLAFPFVFLGIFVAGNSGTGWLGEWLTADVLYAIVLGLAIGAVCGRAVAALIFFLRARAMLNDNLDGWLAIATVLAVYGLTEAVGAYGFLAAFTGGLSFRRYEAHREYIGRIHGGAEAVEKFSELALLLVLGSTVTLAGLAEPGVSGWVLVPLLLLVIRPLAVAVALAGSPVPRSERAFIGFFGIRGIGSFYCVAVAIGAGVLTPAEAATVYWTVVVCVGVSIVLHGVTATPATKRLAEAEAG